MIFLTEDAKATGSAHPVFLLIWVAGIIMILSTLILLLDYISRYEDHYR
jgi:cytochrome c oxidase subunit IV